MAEQLRVQRLQFRQGAEPRGIGIGSPLGTRDTAQRQQQQRANCIGP
ncbi:MAG TPA: hypothetical protein VGF89_10170 [Steroidobacteraceae bacterium]